MISFQRPQSIGRIFFSSFRMYAASLATAFPFLILFLVLAYVPYLFLLFEKMPGFAEAFYRFFQVLTYLMLIFLPFISLWISAVVVLRVNGRLMSQELRCSVAGRKAWERYPIYLISSLVFLAVVLIGMCLFILPGIFLAILFSFQWFCILLDNKDVVGSFKQSAYLVKGNWWRVFLLMILVLVTNSLVSSIIAIPVWFILEKYGVDSFHMTSVANVLISFFIIPWHASVYLILYRDLKARKQMH